MKRVWILTELFYPEETSTSYILAKIANYLSEDTDVCVICGPEQYDSSRKLEKDTSFEPNEKVKIFRQSAPSLNKNKLLSRLLKQIIISTKMSWTLLRRLHKDDIIFIVTNPAPLLILTALIKRFKKNKLIILVHDVFPENTIPAGVLKSEKSFGYKCLAYIFSKAYSAADVLVAIGRDMQEKVVQKLRGNTKNTDVVIVENWGDTEHIKPLYRTSSEKLIIQYAGNVGRVQGLKEFFETFNNANNPFVELDVWGDGAMKKHLEELVKSQKIENVNFHGSYHRKEQEQILNDCDIALVSLADGMYGLGVPSKTYNIMAAGKPILYIGDEKSEIALVIKEYNNGYVFNGYDENLKQWLSNLKNEDKAIMTSKGKISREIVEKKFSEKVILDKFKNIIDKI